jgi:hypothetical protein
MGCCRRPSFAFLEVRKVTVVSIPLYERGAIVASALVDEADYAIVAEYKWRLLRTKWSNCYASCGRRVNGRFLNIFMHRLLMGLAAGEGHTVEVDHINGNGLDNRRQNLRKATPSQNQQNYRARKGFSSSHRGVSWCKRDRRWRATYHLMGKEYYVGSFVSEEDASRAVSEARARAMPFTVEPAFS